MKFKTEYLKKIVNIVSSGLPAKAGVHEYFGSFFFLNGRLGAYNGSRFISVDMDLAEISFAVIAQEFVQYVNRVKEEEVNIRLNDEETELVIESTKEVKNKKKTEAAFPIKTDIPEEIREFATDGNWKDVPGEFRELVKPISFACATDQSDLALTCIIINGNKMFAANRAVAAMVRMSDVMYASEDENDCLLISKDDIGSIINPEQFRYDDHWVHFKCEDHTVSVRRYSVAPPAIARMEAAFAVGEAEAFTVPEELFDAVKETCVFENTMNQIQLRFTQGAITVHGQSSKGRARHTVESDFKGDNVAVWVPYSLIVQLKMFLSKMYLCPMEGGRRIIMSGERLILVIAAQERNDD